MKDNILDRQLSEEDREFLLIELFGVNPFEYDNSIKKHIGSKFKFQTLREFFEYTKLNSLLYYHSIQSGDSFD